MIHKYGALDPIFEKPEYSQIPMAVIGIVMKFFQIFISVVVGLSASCTPIASYNVGAGRPDRVKSLFTLLLKCEAVLGLTAFVIEVIFGAGLTIIMPMFMWLDGVLWSMPASDALTFVISVCVIVMIYRELSTQSQN